MNEQIKTIDEMMKLIDDIENDVSLMEHKIKLLVLENDILRTELNKYLEQQ